MLLIHPGLPTAHAFETRTGTLESDLPAPILRLRQVHGARVLRIDESTDLAPYRDTDSDRRHAGDAMVTAIHGVTLAISTADCVPVLLFDPRRRVVAAAHAGWRGVAAGVLPATVTCMQTAYGSRPQQLRAAIGPCIGRDVYLVDAPVRDAFRAAALPDALFAAARQPDGGPGWLCDMAGAARAQLVAAGVPASQVHALDLCTHADPRRFHSYRRDGDAAGRMLSGIALRR